MWMGELIIDSAAIGIGMSLIIFGERSSCRACRAPSSPLDDPQRPIPLMGVAITGVNPACGGLPAFPRSSSWERAQRPHHRRVELCQARAGSQDDWAASPPYIPRKVNAAGVIPIIFASCLIYFPGAAGGPCSTWGWLTAVADAISHRLGSSGILTVLLIVSSRTSTTSMVFNPRRRPTTCACWAAVHPRWCCPGTAPVDLYQRTCCIRVHACLAGNLHRRHAPWCRRYIFYFTGNYAPSRRSAARSNLIMVPAWPSTPCTRWKSQLKMHNYEGFCQIGKLVSKCKSPDQITRLRAFFYAPGPPICPTIFVQIGSHWPCGQTGTSTSGPSRCLYDDLRVYYAPFGAHSFASCLVFLLKCARTA